MITRIRNIFLFTAFTFSAVALNAQVEIGEKSTKKENKRTDTTSWNLEVFGYTNWSQTFRTLQENTGLFGKELGERANEYALNTWSYGIGFRSRINEYLAWEGGMAYLSNGEGYRFEDTDTIFEYTNKYNYIAMPVKLNFLYGKDFGFIASAGVIPQMFISVKHTEHWRDSGNSTGNVEEIHKNGYNSFVASAVFNVGGFVRFNKKWVLGFIPEYRFQFINSYKSTDPYLHYGRALGFNISLGMQL